MPSLNISFVRPKVYSKNLPQPEAMHVDEIGMLQTFLLLRRRGSRTAEAVGPFTIVLCQIAFMSPLFIRLRAQVHTQ